MDYTDVPLPSADLTWTVEFCDTNSTNAIAGPLSGTSGGSFTIPATGEQATNGFYNISLTAIDVFGRSATNDINIFPNPTNLDWTSIYSFDNGAVDTNGPFSGTLANGSTTTSKPHPRPGAESQRFRTGQYVALPGGIGSR